MVAAATTEPARAGRAGPQLRLPLRLDPRPVLRRAGRRRGRRRTRCSTPRSRFVAERLLADGPQPAPGLHRRRRPGARPAAARPARLPGRRRSASATGSTTSSSSTPSARRCCCSPPPTAHDRLDAEHWQGRRGRGRGDRGAPRRARRRDLGARRPALDALPADLRGRAARRRRSAARRPGRAAWQRARRRAPRRHRARLPAPRRPLAARPRRPGSTPRCCCPALRGAVPADDPRNAGDAGGGRRRAQPRTATSTGSARTTGRSAQAEGAFLLCGFHHGAGRRTSRATSTAASAGSSATGPRCGPPGLFTEEFDVVQRQLRGNLPQAFVHAAAARDRPQRLAARGRDADARIHDHQRRSGTQ